MHPHRPPPVPARYPYHYPYQPRGTNVMAILALVLAFVVAPAAIVLGHLARQQIRQTGEDGDALALAGLIVGYVLTGITALFLLVFFLAYAATFLLAVLGLAVYTG